MNAVSSSNRMQAIRRVVMDFAEYSRVCYPDKPLRGYQLEAALPLLDRVTGAGFGGGLAGTHTILFARQAGKDELLARVYAYLLLRYKFAERYIVVAAPTFRPQSVVSRRRLVARMNTPLHRGMKVVEGYRVTLGSSGVSYMSADPKANARSETASLLLVANEAQDIEPGHWDATFAPMAASTNAPLAVAGTPWIAGSLLSRERALTRDSGSLYEADWQRVAEEVPEYGEYVRGQIAKLGADHPFIKSEYWLQEIGSDGGLFPPQRQAQMMGAHERQRTATPGKTYALLIDLAGEDEDQDDAPASRGRQKRRDSTALTVVEVDVSTVRDPLIARPTYRVVDRMEWVGTKHTLLYQAFIDLALNVWKARYIVVDATGVGAGLSSFLASAFVRTRTIVHPFVFSLKSKSDLGWDFLGVVESGRYKDYAPDGAADTGHFWQQVANCEYTVDLGPGRVMRWSVPERRGHDDLLISSALVGYLDGLEWRPREFGARSREDYT